MGRRLRIIRRLHVLALGATLTLGTASGVAAQTGFDAVQPLLARDCVLCHQGANAPLGLRLDSLAGVLAGSARGPVVKAGDAAGSELVRRLDGRSQPRMPLTGPPYIGDADLALLRAWIDQGLAPGAAATPGAVAPASAPAGARAPDGVPTWRDVAPILATRCTRCHAPQGQLGPAPEGYVLTSHAAATSAADRARIVPGQPAASELLRRVKGHARPRMPLDGPPYLASAEIDLIEAWIAAGARDSLGQPAPMPVGARIRLRGVLSPDGTLDGLALPGGAHGDGRGGRGGGRRDRAPQAGAAVELRGSVLPDGHIAVERLRGR